MSERSWSRVESVTAGGKETPRSGNPGSLHMVQVGLVPRALLRFGKGRNLPQDADLGYLTHCVLGELFGDLAPRPFSIDATPKGRTHGSQTVLGYATVPAAGLRQHALEMARPEAWAVANLDSLVSKPMPATWPEGTRYSFKVRCCPVVRMASGAQRHRKGAEVDAFLARCFRAESPDERVDRFAVYSEWLAGQLDRYGGARIVESRVSAFLRRRLVRRTSQGTGRRARTVERPDVIFSGVLEVMSSEGFSNLLRRGIGRHRAFGFGMLLLSPARTGDES